MSASNLMLEQALIHLLSKCSTIYHLCQTHARIITHGFHHNPYITPKLASLSFRLRNPVVAHKVFDGIRNPNVVLYNVMFEGFTKVGMHRETVGLFRRMRRDGVEGNEFTFTFVIKSLGVFSSSVRDGEQVHCLLMRSGWVWSNHFVGTGLVDLYSQFLDVVSAYKVFEEMAVKNVVTWTAMVRGYVSVGDVGKACEVFYRAGFYDVVLWNTMISGYTERGDMGEAHALFDKMPRCYRDAMAWNTILLGYGNADDHSLVEECERFFFEEMPEEKKNVFSWNALVGVYTRHGQFSRVLVAFKQMLFRASFDHIVKPNDATMAVLLSACSKLSDLNFGRQIHSFVTKTRHYLLMYSCVDNGLVDMYAKCGCIDEASCIFSSMDGRKRDLVTWNSMITGLAAHGKGKEALELFETMKAMGKKPDGISFVGALSACVHSGLVDRGLSCFKLMVEDCKIDPWIEHYGCVVDLLGRAGLIDEALDFVKRMPLSMMPDCVIWSTLLGACQQQMDDIGHGNVQEQKTLIIAEIAMSRLVRLEPEDLTHYVMLSNMYAACRRWTDVARLKWVVNRTGSEWGKQPGWSWVQLDSQSQLIQFCSSDTRHSRSKEIYETLQVLTNTLKLAGFPN